MPRGSSLASSVLQDAAKKAEDRLTAIHKAIAAEREKFEKAIEPLQLEADELREAVARITGRGGRRRSARRPSGTSSGRQRLSPAEREQQALEVIRETPGINGVQVAERLGVSTTTAAKAINSLIKNGKVKAEGERRNRRLLPA